MEFTVHCREISSLAQTVVSLNVRETFVIEADTITIALFRKFIKEHKDDSIGSIIRDLRNSHLREFRDAAQKISRFVNEFKDSGLTFVTYIE